MKKDELKNLQELTAPEMEIKIRDMKAQLYTMQHQLQLAQLKNYNTIGSLKRDIARLNTFIQMKKTAGAPHGK